MVNVAKTKTKISFAVTAKLICVFVFAYAERWFSHDAAQSLNNLLLKSRLLWNKQNMFQVQMKVYNPGIVSLLLICKTRFFYLFQIFGGFASNIFDEDIGKRKKTDIFPERSDFMQ